MIAKESWSELYDSETTLVCCHMSQHCFTSNFFKKSENRYNSEIKLKIGCENTFRASVKMDIYLRKGNSTLNGC